MRQIRAARHGMTRRRQGQHKLAQSGQAGRLAGWQAGRQADGEDRLAIFGIGDSGGWMVENSLWLVFTQ